MATLKGSFPASKPGGKAGKGKAAAPAQVAVTDSAEQEHQRVADELKRFDFDSVRARLKNYRPRARRNCHHAHRVVDADNSGAVSRFHSAMALTSV